MRPAESFVGQSVRSLQTMLRTIGKANGQALTVIPDGFYGTQTRNAVSDFQQRRGLPSTGVVDQPTWERIAAEFPDAKIRTGPAEPLRLILNPNQVLRMGESHPYLYLIQVMLNALAEAYGSIPSVSITGILDHSTADSVSEFQRLSLLPTTGEVDKLTWKHLALHYPLSVNLGYSQNKTQR